MTWPHEPEDDPLQLRCPAPAPGGALCILGAGHSGPHTAAAPGGDDSPPSPLPPASGQDNPVSGDARDERLRGTVRETSEEAFRYLIESGILSEQRARTYTALYRRGPGTSAEIIMTMLAGVKVRTLTQNRARFTELRDMGLARELGTVTCQVTGRRAILWDVTGRVEPLPLARRTKPTRSQLLEEVAQIAGEALVLLQEASEVHADLLLRVEVWRLRDALRDWKIKAEM